MFECGCFGVCENGAYTHTNTHTNTRARACVLVSLLRPRVGERWLCAPYQVYAVPARKRDAGALFGEVLDLLHQVLSAHRAGVVRAELLGTGAVKGYR